jgi:hypothetical protein
MNFIIKQDMKNNLKFALDEFLGVNESNSFIKKMETKYPNGQIPISDPDYIKHCKLMKRMPTNKEMSIFLNNALKLNSELKS